MFNLVLFNITFKVTIFKIYYVATLSLQMCKYIHDRNFSKNDIKEYFNYLKCFLAGHFNNISKTVGVIMKLHIQMYLNPT